MWGPFKYIIHLRIQVHMYTSIELSFLPFNNFFIYWGRNNKSLQKQGTSLPEIIVCCLPPPIHGNADHKQHKFWTKTNSDASRILLPVQLTGVSRNCTSAVHWNIQRGIKHPWAGPCRSPSPSTSHPAIFNQIQTFLLQTDCWTFLPVGWKAEFG